MRKGSEKEGEKQKRSRGKESEKEWQPNKDFFKQC